MLEQLGMLCGLLIIMSLVLLSGKTQMTKKSINKLEILGIVILLGAWLIF